MAKPVIGMIATPQNFALGVTFNLTVSITGVDTSVNGNTVKVSGLLEGFSYAFDNMTNMLTITGTPTRLLSGKNMKIVATNSDGPTEKVVVFNVVPAAPVITQVTAPIAYIGRPYSFFIPITNRPPSPTVEGLWSGLKYGKHKNSRGQEGVLISGTVAAGDFTVDSDAFTVNAPYAGGLVSSTFDYSISEVPLPGVVRNMRAWRSGANYIVDWDAPTNAAAAVVDYYDTHFSSDDQFYGWHRHARVTDTRRVVTGFHTNTQYWLRVRAVGHAGAGSEVLITHTFT